MPQLSSVVHRSAPPDYGGNFREYTNECHPVGARSTMRYTRAAADGLTLRDYQVWLEFPLRCTRSPGELNRSLQKPLSRLLA